jgi:hypothetical protein
LSKRDCFRADLAGETDYSISHFGRTEYSEKFAADLLELACERRGEFRSLRRGRHWHRSGRICGVRVVSRAGAERVLYARDYFVKLGHVSLAADQAWAAYAGAGVGSRDT